MFNVCVDAVIREWLCWTLGKEATQGRFEEASREIVALFVDNGLVGLRNLIWLQRPYKSS
jgi:hypothetical protein